MARLGSLDGRVTSPASLSVPEHTRRDGGCAPLLSPAMSQVVPLSPSFESLVAAPQNTDEPPPLEAPLSPKVRFDQDCVLIPDPLPTSRLPRLVTKSYSLPLWKRKQREPSLVSDTEDDSSEDHVVFKVSVPRSVCSIFCSSYRHRPPVTSPSRQPHHQGTFSIPRRRRP